MLDHRVIIIGAGGFGQELAEYVCDYYDLDLENSDNIVFLDDNPKLGSKVDSWKIIGSLDNFDSKTTDKFLIGLGTPEERIQVAKILKQKKLELMTLIHPRAYVSKTAILEKGCIIGPFCIVGYKSKISHNVLLNTYSAVGHHAKVGANSVISPKALLSGYSEVEDNVFLGAGVIITPSKKVESGAKVGAGSVVYRNVKSNKTVVGNPAKDRLN